jgi:tRNA pseudouridine38-40 synthase
LAIGLLLTTAGLEQIDNRQLPIDNANERNLRLQLNMTRTDFHGWQIQPNLPTVQGSLTEAIGSITAEEVHVNGSGRTDAGVHALAQVCNFLTQSKIAPFNLQKALNSVLPPSIRVIKVEEVPEQFHARHDAKAKHYRYRILKDKWCSPFDFRYAHHYPRSLDLERMSQAAELIVGERLFSLYDSDSGGRIWVGASFLPFLCLTPDGISCI